MPTPAVRGDRFRFEYPNEPQFNRVLRVTDVTGYGPEDLVFFDDHTHTKQRNLQADMRVDDHGK